MTSKKVQQAAQAIEDLRQQDEQFRAALALKLPGVFNLPSCKVDTATQEGGVIAGTLTSGDRLYKFSIGGGFKSLERA